MLNIQEYSPLNAVELMLSLLHGDWLSLYSPHTDITILTNHHQARSTLAQQHSPYHLMITPSGLVMINRITADKACFHSMETLCYLYIVYGVLEMPFAVDLSII